MRCALSFKLTTWSVPFFLLIQKVKFWLRPGTGSGSGMILSGSDMPQKKFRIHNTKIAPRRQHWHRHQRSCGAPRLWEAPPAAGRRAEQVPGVEVLGGGGTPGRFADPHSFHPAPDPAFKAEYRSGSRSLMTKNLKKITAGKKLTFFWSKATIYLRYP